MLELEIPERAYNAFALGSTLRGYRILVASELRRIVNLEGDDIKSWRLLKRADELDPLCGS